MGSLARWWQSCGREWRSWKVGVLSKRGVAFLVAVSVFNPWRRAHRSAISGQGWDQTDHTVLLQ